MKKRLCISLLLAFTISMLSGCGKDNVYSSPGNSYAEINCIDDLAFYIPFSITNQATAVTQIVDGMGYDSNSIYTFNNGTDKYIMFCMDQLIVIAEKGTSFHFMNAADKGSCLNNSAVINTWFKPSGKSFSFSDNTTSNNIYKLITPVSAEVVITSELYGDYVGKLAVIDYEESEWSLFVGVVADSVSSMSKQQSSLVDAIVQSMQLKSKPVKEAVQYDVILDHNLQNEEQTENAPEVSDESNEETVSEPITSESPAPITSAEPSASPAIDPEPATETEPDKPFPSSTPELGKKGVNLSNQRTIEKEAGKAYASDEYSMLSVGQCGFFDAFSSDQTMERPVVCVNKVYTGEEAVRIIKDKIKGQDTYSYFDAPDGYSWNVIQYDLSYANCVNIPYTNIRLVGVDGNDLRFRGITVDSRTHDANNFTSQKDDCVYNCYCYYAVPNGCHEYALTFGDGKANDNRGLAIAYYYIKVN